MSEGKAGNRAAREFPGLLRDLTQKVLGENGEEWLDALKPFLHKRNPWPEISSIPAKKRYKVLQPLKTVAEFPKTAEFKAIDHLQITPDNERVTAELVIGYISPNVEDNFLADGGKVETSIFDSKLRPYRLRKDSVDGPIIADLGGVEAAETTVAEMIALMKAQGRGQQGILLTNGYANIFYIKDTKGVLWAVCCDWHSDGRCWLVSAGPIAGPGTWSAGFRVFSRDSLDS